jgi:hypothetical protein
MEKNIKLWSTKTTHTCKRQIKYKVHLRTGHDGPEGEQRYSSILYLNSAIDWGFAVVMKSGKLNFLESSGPLQACNGTALPFTTFSLHWGGWSTPRLGRFTPEKETRHSLYRGLVGLKGRSGWVRKISHPYRDAIPGPSSPWRVAIPTALSKPTQKLHIVNRYGKI